MRKQVVVCRILNAKFPGMRSAENPRGCIPSHPDALRNADILATLFELKSGVRSYSLGDTKKRSASANDRKVSTRSCMRHWPCRIEQTLAVRSDVDKL